jgi:hypothetical protein
MTLLRVSPSVEQLFNIRFASDLFALLFNELSWSPWIHKTAHPIARNLMQDIRVSSTFGTISSRLDSFQEWPYTKFPPQQLAVAGFYSDPCDEDPDRVTCFSCGVQNDCWNLGGAFTDEE